MKRLILILITILLSQTWFGQGGFIRKYKLPGSFNNISKNIFETTPGNYIVCGICVDTLNGFLTNRLVMSGLNNLGQPQWIKKYGNSKFEYLDNSLISKWFYKQGNFIYHAGCVRDSNNKQIGVLIKFNFNGDTIWQKMYRDPTDDVIPQMVTGSVDNGFYITGFFQDLINNIQPALLIKTDINGNELWRKKINKGVPNAHDAKVIIQDSASKKIITVGYQYIGSVSAYSDFPSVIIMDSLGNKLSENNNGSGARGAYFDLIQTKDKKFIAVGDLFQGSLGNLDTYKSFIIKFDINSPGAAIWNKQYDKTAITNFFTRITELNNENLLVTGVLDTMQQNSFPTNCLQRITKFDKNGNVLTNRYYDYSPNHSADNNQSILSLNPTSDNSFVSAFQVFNTSPNPFFVVKYDSTLCDSSQFYCQSVGLNELKVNEEFINFYPNPTNGFLNINSQLNLNSDATVRFTNLLGQTIFECKAENKIDINHLATGIYFLQLYNNGRLLRSEKIVKE